MSRHRPPKEIEDLEFLVALAARYSRVVGIHPAAQRMAKRLIRAGYAKPFTDPQTTDGPFIHPDKRPIAILHVTRAGTEAAYRIARAMYRTAKERT